MAEVSGKPFVPDAVFKGRQGFGIRTVDDLVLLVKNLVQNFLADSPGCWIM